MSLQRLLRTCGRVAVSRVEIGIENSTIRSTREYSYYFLGDSSVSNLVGSSSTGLIPEQSGGNGNPAVHRRRRKGIVEQPIGQRSVSTAHPVESKPIAVARTTETCWNCGSSFDESRHYYFCDQCNKIQPLAHASDYFTLFNYSEPTFDIYAGDLESRYKSLQVRLHPDKFATATFKEQEYSADQAAAVNQAYEVLRQPLKRAQYLLTGSGLGACEGLTVREPELLEPVMEAREEVESTDNKEELKNILNRVNQQEEEYVEALREAFRKKDLDEAAATTIVLRYVARVKEAIIDKL